MKRLLFLLAILLQLPLTVAAQDAEPEPELEYYRQRMYDLYSTDSMDLFMEVTNHLKELALKAGDERTFYRAWANQCVNLFRKTDHTKGQEELERMQVYAKSRDSKFGQWSAASANVTMMSILKMTEQAEKGYWECIEYIHHYFPDESAASDYLGIIRIVYNRYEYQRVKELVEEMFHEPNLNDVHRQAALGYLYLAEVQLAGDPPYSSSDIERMNTTFNEWHDAYMKAGRSSGLKEIIEYHHAKVNGNYERALAIAREMPSTLNRLSFVPKALARLGRYKEAYDAMRLYVTYTDSVNSAESKRLASESSLQSSVWRAESEARESKARTRIIIGVSAGVVALLIIIFLIIYTLRRRQQLRELRRAYDRLEETTSAKERIESELRIARDIQMSMVPRVFPAFPDRTDIDLYALMVPAKEVGGDLYDFFIEGDSFHFCVGDVSGKGVPASMTMAVAVNLFRSVSKDGYSPAEVATKINATLSADNENSLFVTMFIGQVDLKTGRMDFCNAGHNPPLIGTPRPHSSQFDYHFITMEANAPIGLWPDMQFAGEHIDDIKGQPFFIYTDGVSEAENVSQQQFGEERMLRLLHHATQPFGERTPKTYSHFIIDEMKHGVETFVDGADPSDDLTMLCFKISR